MSSLPTDESDPNQWLEDIDDETALDWVRARNAEAESELFADPRYDRLRAGILEVLEADDRIPMPGKHGDEVLNFWTDSSHRRGLLRRTTWDSYRSESPDWEVVLDIDALSEREGQSWVFHGANLRKPDRRRALVELSPGGSDASTTREFDMVDKRFVPEDEGGFVRPVAKGWLQWVDDDTVLVGHDFGPDTLTTSGYPRTVRLWRRGTALADAVVVFEGEREDVSVHAYRSTLPGHRHVVFRRGIDFYNSRTWIERDGRDGERLELDLPTHAGASPRGPWLAVSLRKDWSVGGDDHRAGALLVIGLDAFIEGDRQFTTLYEPTDTSALGGYFWTRNHMVLRIHEHVRDRLEVLTPPAAPGGGAWKREPLPGAPDLWTVAAGPFDPDENDELLLTGVDFLTPQTIFFQPVGGSQELLKSAPARFSSEGLTIEQRFTTSADGTRIPYFLVGPADRREPTPTLLDGYGGFEVSSTAGYSGSVGRAWLSAGGTYVLANIRGGGEYGPRWHQAGLRENRHRVYEDFEAVARALIADGVTTPSQLGIKGGSNGGLLVGNMYVRAPELFGAVVCQVPLLDMKRYSHLLAGASWMAEYGDPDVEEDWAFIKTFSPYHLIEPDRPYPPLLLTTSTRDDRVHPGHARKMAKALLDLGYDVTYWENIEGGHGGAADAAQQATMWALTFTFLHRHLMDPVQAGAKEAS